MAPTTAAGDGPIHENLQVLRAGTPLERASAAMILVHGRGATPRDIMTIAAELAPTGWCYLAPQAPDGQWYPQPFTAPLEANEPCLSAAMRSVGTLVQEVEALMPADRLVLLGFSQGACLTLEYAARNSRRYGGVVGLSGALIGPTSTPRDYPGSLAGTPVFLGCSDVDPHVARSLVEDAATVLASLDGEVTTRLYEGMGHTTNQDEMDFIRGLMASVSPP